MKLISFDIGIKNMAYCFFDVSVDGPIISIIDWNVLNLMEAETPKIPCSQFKTKKKVGKKGTAVAAEPCAHMAKYKKCGQYYCDKHAKASTEYIVPAKQNSASFLTTRKVDEVWGIACSLQLYSPDAQRPKKADIITALNAYYREHCFETLVVKSREHAGDTDLIVIGRNMAALLDTVPSIGDVTHVLIENQISTLATRMKTIQGMLAQYFIMRCPQSRIEFVSSANKLKGYTPDAQHLENTLSLTASQRYREHKRDAILYCSQLLGENTGLVKWLQKWNGEKNEEVQHGKENAVFTKKKDDLADCFLQGMWYVKKTSIVDM